MASHCWCVNFACKEGVRGVIDREGGVSLHAILSGVHEEHGMVWQGLGG